MILVTQQIMIGEHVISLYSFLITDLIKDQSLLNEDS